jgi:UDP-N-acetyl-D-galactosamine dehydrogenase
MIKKGISVKNSDILVLGITFKENCPDIRNTKVVDVVNSLKEYGVNITIHDPWANSEEVKREYGLDIINQLPGKKFDAIITAVIHKEFNTIDFSSLQKENSVLYNFKS